MPHDRLDQVREEAHRLYRKGVEAQEKGNYAEAEEAYKQCLLMMKALGNQNGEAASLHHLGTIFEARGDFQKAKEYYRESFKLFKADNDHQNCIFSLFFQAILHLKTEEFDRAIDLVIEALELCFEEGAAFVHEAWSRIRQIAGVLLAYRKIQQMARLGEKVLDISKKISQNNEISPTRRQLAKITERIGLLILVSGRFWDNEVIRDEVKEKEVINWLLQTAVNLDQSPAIGLSFTDFVAKVIQEKRFSK